MEFILKLDETTTNDLIAALEVSRRQGDFKVARTAVIIISELLRQDAEHKNPATTQPTPPPTNVGGELPQP